MFIMKKSLLTKHDENLVLSKTILINKLSTSGLNTFLSHKITNEAINFFLISEKFINFLMKDGKKAKAYYIFYLTLNILKNKITHVSSTNLNKNISILSLLLIALNNVKPYLDIRKVRVAGTTYQVPTIVSKKKQYTLAIRWIIQSAKKRKKVSAINFSECLAQEIFDAYNKQGYARLKRDELHKIAEINRAYLRYRWW